MGQSYSYVSSFWYSSSNNIDETITQLSKQHDTLTKKIIEMENKKSRIQSLAVQEFQKKKHNKAISLMKIKKLYEHEITKIENLLFCIATQELALTSSCTLQDSLSTIKHASCTMKALNTNIDLSKIENTIDIVNDTHDLNNEIQDTLNHQNFADPGSVTDDDLLNELKLLTNNEQQELNPNTFVNITATPLIQHTNNKPTTPPPPVACEIELQQLKADKIKKLLPIISEELHTTFDKDPQPEIAM
mgnify:CR=1 FL=1